ncbi:hypothetical protein N665_0497s0009 [Sinapis alba]|nr:hypothetical protein N665_0497s0009 [Sinapis alba]
MISKTIFVCIFVFSFFALRQCRQMDVGEIESKLVIPKCIHSKCSDQGFFQRDCWCCMKDLTLPCFKKQSDCESDWHCPLIQLKL